MKFSDFKKKLTEVKELNFRFPDHNLVPQHFHITEVGISHKKFVDCGGEERGESNIVLQIWIADDTEHRLTPDKLLSVLEKAEKSLDLNSSPIDYDVEIECDRGLYTVVGDDDMGAVCSWKTLSKYGVVVKEGENDFYLDCKTSECLAKHICLPKSCCPDTGCC